jgi:hypothetical protein
MPQCSIFLSISISVVALVILGLETAAALQTTLTLIGFLFFALEHWYQSFKNLSYGLTLILCCVFFLSMRHMHCMRIKEAKPVTQNTHKKHGKGAFLFPLMPSVTRLI